MWKVSIVCLFSNDYFSDHHDKSNKMEENYYDKNQHM